MVSGKWALVTGASGGMGAEFASLLAERGFNLVLAARSFGRLETIATNLRRFGVRIHVEQSDLTQDGSAASLVEAIRIRDIKLDVLINNAGQGLHGAFIDQSGDSIDRMLHLNIASLTTLTHTIASDMADRRCGHILLVASLTAFMPCPTYAAYAATKAYVRNFGEALHAEMAPRNVVVTVLSPGLMDTGFLSASGQAPSKSMKRAMTSPREAAETGLKALFAGRQTVVAGSMNKVAAVASRLLPRGMQTRIAAAALKG
ncbi:SDR family NAD(P)-dependent oxidoreductase [Devosia sp. BK]|uniref:SDR family NAD(P)-dependent oxidoreductase n=1 Tax=Devosia sp. BK TaxID=2871706 RepID=UPI002939FA53|nr:SDR family NAD(P)-dependent oxidoreductase [Devosia sp. BK]MDV3253737.1 SDR family NAD(P)-dependent oxidoreductase [Devosia sp. BK]